MDRKELLKKANNMIALLIEDYVSLKLSQYQGCCLRVVLLNKDRNCGIECSECNRKSKEMYKQGLLKYYSLKE